MAVEHLKNGTKFALLDNAERVDFGPLSYYRPLLADGTTPVRTGIQAAEPGYVAPMHSHPYTEILFIIEGEADVWAEGEEHAKRRLRTGDTVALPPDVNHSFAVVGDQPMRLLGIHHSRERIVNYLTEKTDDRGYPLKST
jgi:quercetin dioxygenase-like cupin family protein